MTLPALLLAALAAALLLPAPAAAERRATVLDIPCVPLEGGVQHCEGVPPLLRVPSWDGVPLDVNVTLPPAEEEGPFPLIVGLHGFGSEKHSDVGSPQRAFELAREGYVVLTYTARGLAGSCGIVATRTPDCAEGWVRLADARYEARDAQHLAALLVDEGIAKPRRIGVTGTSYGGGTTMLLATLRDRIMLLDGSLAPWKSPAGTPMRIAAAAPKIGWSDLAYALVPTGRTLDFRARNGYGPGIGIVKQSYLTGLFMVGLPGYYAPPGADPEADIITWFAELSEGEPYDPELVRQIKTLFRRYRSAYSLQSHLPRREQHRPAPLVIYNGWTDDIMPPTEAVRYYNRVKARWPKAPIGLVFADEFAHNRGSLVAPATMADEQREILFDRYLKGNRDARPLNGSLVATQSCAGSPRLGPFRKRSWHAQHPGEVRVGGAEVRTIDQGGGSLRTAQTTDPFFGGTACRTIEAGDDPAAATYVGEPAPEDGFTLIGFPTITARIEVTGTFPQVIGRLWDVGPDGRQTLVTHGIYRPRPSGRQTFQLEPQGWHFAAGHRPKLELLGQSLPYAQPSAGRFEAAIRRLRLELPVRERPDGGQVKPYAPPVTLKRR